MSTDNKISTLVENQLPNFFLEEGENFVSFLKAYYEFLEQSNNAINSTQNLLKNRDIDKTLNSFIDHFRKEVMPSIPKEVLADKRLLAKYIKTVYQKKGVEEAYKFLFRALYNEEIQIYYPRNFILVASDGRWVKEQSIRISEPTIGRVEDFNSRFVVGLDTGATGRVERIEQKSESGVDVYELFLEDISGTFESGEKVETSTSNNLSTIISTIGPLSSLSIVDSGAFHNEGDVLDFLSPSGVGANGSVIETSDGESIQAKIIDGGSGYSNNEIYSIPGGSGKGAEFRITNISNTEIISVNQDKIDPVKFVPLNESPTFTSNGANTSTVLSNFASANINSSLISSFTFSNTEVGKIVNIETTNFGSGYEQVPPNFTPVDRTVGPLYITDNDGGFKGRNAVIGSTPAPGSIISLNINSPGEGYRVVDPVTIINRTNTSSVNAIATPSVTGVRDYEGKYIDTKGFLSWDMMLQDNYFFQTFSYVVQSQQTINKYKELVKDIVHPAGVQLFGEYQINIDNSFQPEISFGSVTRKIQSNINAVVPSVITFTTTDTITSDYEVEEASIISPTVVSGELNVNTYTEATGTLTVTSNQEIGYYSTYTVSGWYNVPVNNVGSSFTAISDFNNFESFLSNGDIIVITSGTANTGHVITNLYTDTVMRIGPEYPYNSIANATFDYTT